MLPPVIKSFYITPFVIDKPSISMDHGFHGYSNVNIYIYTYISSILLPQ